MSLVVLAVDDEPPALDELAYLLNADGRVAHVHRAGDATEALRVLRDTEGHVARGRFFSAYMTKVKERLEIGRDIFAV